MRRILSTVVLLSLLMSGLALAKDKVYGDGVSEGAFTPISAIVAEPEAYAGKTVRIEGTAVGVCAHRGCWVTLASDVEGETLRVKVEDGVIVFPKNVVGEQVKVEGVLMVNKIEKPCDSNKPGEPQIQCQTLLEVRGTGAVVAWK